MENTMMNDRAVSIPVKCLDELTFAKAEDSDMKRENANINGSTPMGMMLKYGSTISKEYYLDSIIPKEYSKAHKSGYIHIHDLDFYPTTTTCTQINLTQLFKNGFGTGHGFLRKPNSIGTYSALGCIAIQSNQNDQHGGQSIPMFDYDMAPGVALTFKKNFTEKLVDALTYEFNTLFISDNDAKELVENILETIKNNYALEPSLSNKYIDKFLSILADKLEGELHYRFNEICTDVISPLDTILNDTLKLVWNKAYKKTDRDTYQAMEAFIHNCNSMHSRAGGQTPFSSINYGTDTSAEGRMVMSNLLKALDAGLGNGETPIFPIHIFKVKEGVNFNVDDPNYDLFIEACRVSAKRLFPNFSFIDAPFNKEGYVEGNPDTEIAYMGCVRGNETITYKFNDKTYYESFENFWTRISGKLTENEYGISRYFDTDGVVSIYDSSSNGFVNCKKLIKNPNKNNWVRLEFDNDCTLTCTLDHPLPVRPCGKGDTYRRTFVSNIKVGDAVPTENGDFCIVTGIVMVNIDECSYDVETDSDRFDVSGINSHNCRTRVLSNVNGPSTVSGRGNLSFTSVNLPRLAIETMIEVKGDNTKNKEEIFFKKLDDIMELVIQQLLHRYKYQTLRCKFNFPFLMGQGIWMDSNKLDNNDTLESVLKHGTLTIGFIGLAETLKMLTGKHHGESEESQKLGLKIIKTMREKMDKATEDYHLNFSVIATPAEGLSSRFTRLDKERYGIIEGVTDREYYTNSFHVPVYYNISAFKKIQIEAPYHALTNGGHISYIELDGDPRENIYAFVKIVKFMKECGIGYGSINHPVDRDPVCGYTGIIGDCCPMCGRHEHMDGHSDVKFERIRRITGYLVGTLDRFNDGKRAEEADRVKHTLSK